MNRIYTIFIGLVLGACSSNESEKNTTMQSESDTIAAKDTTGAEAPFPDGTYYFSGRIDHKYPFHMQFKATSSKVNGFYFYNSVRKEIELKGYIDGNNLELDESFNGKVTGHFVSNVFTTDSISGIWQSPKGKKMDFVLYTSSAKDYELGLNGVQQNWSKQEFYSLVRKFDQAVFPFKYEPLPLDEEENQKRAFSDKEIRLFINPEFDPDQFIHPRYYYGFTYEAPEFIALVFTEHYVPGAFGIYNSSLVMRTFTKEGKLISEKYLGCNCYDNNMSDYYETNEDFLFEAHEVIITGTEVYASQEYMETEDPEFKPFREEKKINRKIAVLENGEIK